MNKNLLIEWTSKESYQSLDHSACECEIFCVCLTLRVEIWILLSCAVNAEQRL